MSSFSSFFDISLDTANGLYRWGWRLSALGAVATMVGIGVLWWGTRVRDHDFDNQMASLNAEAGNARERAAKLEKDAEEARRETERLKETLAWRELKPSQVDAIKAALAGARFEIPLSFTQSDPEATAFANQLADALVAGGISVTTQPTVWVGDTVFGVRISQTPGGNAERLAAALAAAGIEFTYSAPTAELRMSVGTKPRR